MTYASAWKSSVSSAVLSNFIIRQGQERMWRGLPKDWPLEAPGPLEKEGFAIGREFSIDDATYTIVAEASSDDHRRH